MLEEEGAERLAEVNREMEQVKEHNNELVTQLNTIKVCTKSCVCTHVHVDVHVDVHVCVQYMYNVRVYTCIRVAFGGGGLQGGSKKAPLETQVPPPPLESPSLTLYIYSTCTLYTCTVTGSKYWPFCSK